MEDGLNISIHENVFDVPREIFQRLKNELVYLPEEQSRIRIRNKSFPISRKIVAFGDPDLSYTFSGLTLTSQPWIPLLLDMKNVIENMLGAQFNFVLINRYENGNAYIGQHKDNEVDLDENSCICSISFGETRTMIFKRPGYQNKKIELKSNSMLVMKPPTNKMWSHGIPVQKKRMGVRINLTFRKMKTFANNFNKTQHVDDINKSKYVVNKRKHDQFEAIKGKKLKSEPSNSTNEGAMEHLGRENFVTVNNFLGHTRVHIRRFVLDEEGNFHPSEDGVSLSPKVWHSFCHQVDSIFYSNCKDQIHIIERDLCISKQMKDGLQVFVFQRLFQKPNLSMQFVPEYVVLNCSEVEKLINVKCIITEHLRNGLITYTLKHFFNEELKKQHSALKPDYNSNNFLQLLGSLSQCLLDAIKLKIFELLNYIGCKESYEADFVHACKIRSPIEKWADFFDLALCHINLRDVAQHIVKQNLTFDFVLDQEKFFDDLDVKELFESLKRMYVAEEEKTVMK